MAESKGTRVKRSGYEEALRRIHECHRRQDQFLDLSDLGLTALPPEIGRLTKLTQLRLADNQLATLPSEIGRIKALSYLNLSSNQLTTVPPEIGRLTKLRELRLNDNRLTALPPEIGRLTKLTELHASKNRLTTLPPEIGRLTALTRLFLYSNRLSTLPPEIGPLTRLATLSLSSNQLTTLPPEIGRLTKLMELYLFSNELTTLPRETGQLTAMSILNLGSNQLTTLPPEIGRLAALSTLQLNGNQLTTLPSEIGRLTKLRELSLHDNPGLGLGAEVLGPEWREVSAKVEPASPQAILKAYFALKRGHRPLHEVKLVLLGRGGVGKTCLVRALMGKKFAKQKETPGIAIGAWTLDVGGVNVKVHVWDFAGQEITHEAHRFFLTERCLYLVVTEGRRGQQDEDVEHWLAHVEQYGAHREDGKPPQVSPALVVANQIESSKCPLSQRRLGREHPCVRAFLETDCQTGKGIGELRDKIRQIIASPEMESVRQPFPTEWQKMRELLEDWKTLKRHFFTFAQFAKECHKQKVAKGDQLALTYVLNQLGIALYYGHNPRLRDTRVLDPQWLVSGMYALIRGVEKHGDPGRPGEVLQREVKQRLEQGLKLMKSSLTPANYPAEARSFLLELMEDRELCFVAREKGPVYLLPGLLPTDEPADLASHLGDGPGVRLRFAYKLLPEGLLPRFVVRTHSLSRDLPRWRRGVVLEWRGAAGEETSPATAVVLADMKANRVEVTVRNGTAALRQELAGIVRTHLKNIHAELPSAMEPVEELELSPAGEQWQAVETLELAAQQGKPVQVKVNKELLDLPPEKELSNVEPKTAWQKDAKARALRVFVSYAHKDHKYVNRLTTTYLAVLENEKLVHKWTDGEIRGGEDWDKCIRDEMGSADIVILLLSEDFFASKYIQGVEVKLARKRHKAGEAAILPVLLSGESWKKVDWLKQLQMSPKQKANQNLTPLLDFLPRQDKGWEAVQEQLRAIIATLRSKRERNIPASGKS